MTLFSSKEGSKGQFYSVHQMLPGKTIMVLMTTLLIVSPDKIIINDISNNNSLIFLWEVYTIFTIHGLQYKPIPSIS